MQRTKVEVYGAKEAALSLEAMIQRSDKLQPVFAKAKVQLAAANAANFASNGLPTGGWRPLDAEYGSWKSVRFPGAPPMVRTGRLFQSLTTLTGSVNSISGDSAQFGTTVEYAKFHQRGTFKMPKRQIVFEPPGFAFRLAEDIGGYIVENEIV